MNQIYFELEDIITSNEFTKNGNVKNKHNSFKLKEGMTITHKKFGEGVVVSVKAILY